MGASMRGAALIAACLVSVAQQAAEVARAMPGRVDGAEFSQLAEIAARLLGD